MMLKKLFSENSSITLIVTALFSISLVACSSDGEQRPEYLNASTIESLEIPPKLTKPETKGALYIPEPSDKAKAGEIDVIAPVFLGLALKNDSRLYWLEVDIPVAELWAMLPRFLAAEGIKVDRVEKLLGYIDTAWMNEYKISYNSEKSSSWFSGFSPDYKDRFRIRVEAIQGESKSRLYVSHRGLQINVANDISEWGMRDSEPFLEREILYRFALFSGIEKTGATELLASYNSYQPRVKKITDASNEFEVKGEADTIWLRLQIAMDRLGVDVTQSDETAKTLNVLVGNLNLIETPAEDGSGWFGGLFSGKEINVDDEDEEIQEYKEQPKEVLPEERISLQLQQIVGNYSSKIKITKEDGSEIINDQVWVFRDALLRQLK